MNRHQQRANTAQDRKPTDGQADVISSVYDYLANVAAPTATGATVFLANGDSLYLSAEDARAMCSNAKPGTAQ